MRKNEPPVSVSDTFACSSERLWRALTEPDEMRNWYFEPMHEFKAEIGFATQFAIQNEGRVFTHCWQVVEVEPLKQLSYSWRYAEYPGRAVVHFKLSGSNPTKLEVTMEVQEDFPDYVPEFARESCQSGWDYLIGESLESFLQVD